MHRNNNFQASEFLTDPHDDNQFLLSPSRTTTYNSKDETIRKMEQKNIRLRKQIKRIDEVLQQPEQRITYGIKIPKMTGIVTKKQLDNAYQQISQYQYDIKRVKDVKENGSYVQQIRKLEILLKQKEQLSHKLKKHLADIKKSSKNLVSKLTNDSIKNDYQNKSTKLGLEIKWLRQKLKEAQKNKEMHAQNKQKQLQFIRKLESALLQAGFPSNTIQALRNKHSPNQTMRHEYSRNGYSRITRNEPRQFVEDRTPQAYKVALNEIKLFQKMEKDHSNQINTIGKQYQQASIINMKSRNHLLETEDDIQKIQNKILQLKTMIDPKKLKPNRAYSSLDGGSVGRYGKVNKNLIAIKSTFNHIFKHEEMGKVSKTGRRFSDRTKLGNGTAKIVSIDFYESKQVTCNVMGIRASYEIESSIKKGLLNMICDPNSVSKKTLTLIDATDYIKAIQCVTNQKNLIIGINVTSAKGISFRAGSSEGVRKPLNISRLQYPTFIYGSFNDKGIQLFGAQIVEEQEN